MITIREFKPEDIDNGLVETLAEVCPIDSITTEPVENVLNTNCFINEMD